MPVEKEAASIEEDVKEVEQLPPGDPSEILRQSDRFRTVRRLVDQMSDDQWKSIEPLINLLSLINMSPEDTALLETALFHAQRDRRRRDPEQNDSIMPYLVNSLAQKDDVDCETDGSIPNLTEAPRDSFRGVNADGDAYEFLLKTYGPWLQDGKKCLDRPSATSLDGKLMKALQQKYTRNKRSMPPLSEVFPTVTEARAIREKLGVAGL